MPKIGVVLSGCGVQDGSEIHEATLLLLALDRRGAEAVCFAPDKPQADVVDHATGKPADETREILAESARIARGAIRPLQDARPEDLDALILPGGFGAAKNLCTFAREGADCGVDIELRRLLERLHLAGKPIGAACIAPVILARVFGSEKPVLTIGSDPATAKAIETLGARHQACAATEVVVDRECRFATTPAYMLARRISEVADGMDRLVQEVLELTRVPA